MSAARDGELLNVADCGIVEGAMGPGRRLGIWLQGCHKRCPGCINGAFLSLEPRQQASADMLLTRLDAIDRAAGISLSGGEPLLQAAALLPLLRGVRDRGLSVVCYSGYDWDELRAVVPGRTLAEFLELTDLLIAGEYRPELPPGGPLASSSNQRLHFLRGRILPEQLATEPTHFALWSEGQVQWTGPLSGAVYRQLAEGLRRWGVVLPVRPEPLGNKVRAAEKSASDPA